MHYLLLVLLLTFQYSVTTTRTNGQIVKQEVVVDSVCKQYEDGTIEKRDCLREAAEYFDNKCHECRYDRTGK